MQVNIHEAKTNLSKLLEKLASGEESEITIAKAGQPVAKLIPVPAEKKVRQLGILDGHVDYWEAPDAWEPDEELIDQCINGPLFPDESEDPQVSSAAEDSAEYNSDRDTPPSP
jgi:prevent-host-death family protein